MLAVVCWGGGRGFACFFGFVLGFLCFGFLLVLFFFFFQNIDIFYGNTLIKEKKYNFITVSIIFWSLLVEYLSNITVLGGILSHRFGVHATSGTRQEIPFCLMKNIIQNDCYQSSAGRQFTKSFV